MTDLLERCREDCKYHKKLLEEWNSYTLIQSIEPGHRRATTSRQESTVESVISRRQEIERDLNRSAEQLARDFLEAFLIICKMPNAQQRMMLEAYYLDLNAVSIKKAAEQVGVHERMAYRILPNAIKTFYSLADKKKHSKQKMKKENEENED